MKDDKLQGEDEEISHEKRVQIISDFILSSPPGEFGEVFNDVRALFNDDKLLKDLTSGIIAQYDKNHLTPVKVEASDQAVLLTNHNSLSGSRFLDPRTKCSFLYDHIKKTVGQYEPFKYGDPVENLRHPLEVELEKYVSRHYPNGSCSVFAGTEDDDGIKLIACIECHQFQSKNFWNGQWRSQWTILRKDDTTELTGNLEIQVHYYENGNVQLVCSNEVNKTLKQDCSMKDLVVLIEEMEAEYQIAISENYNVMSNTIFKSLRRLLPVTRTRVDWERITSYQIGKVLKNQ